MDTRPYAYSPIVRRPRLEWPNGARVAFWVGVAVEHYRLDRRGMSISPNTVGFEPDPLNAGWRDYGARVGIWRFMELLDRHAMRASALLNADVCALYPAILEEGARRGWAWVAHGENNSTPWTGMSVDEERTRLARVVETIEQHTGRRPRGWIGPSLTETSNTPDLLAEQGFTHVLDWCCDDQPFPLRTRQGRLVGVPYSIEVNDATLYGGKTLAGEDFGRLILDQFEVLYRESATSGRVMAVSMHPFISGQPFRFKHLERAVDAIAQHEGVWLTTSDEIADWYLARYWDQAQATDQAQDRAATSAGETAASSG